MCGDGANDCGALKAAHVGISLSEEESSVASPFTSKTANISCVPKIVKEGRAALATSIGVFKFMICYSLTQFTSVIVLYSIDSNLSQIQYLFIDICLILNFISIFGKTNAYNGPLHKKQPLNSLLSFACVSSIASQMFLIISFQILAYKLVQTYNWFVPFKFDPEKDYFSYTGYENYAVFSISLFQYIILAISFSKGKPYRMPFYTNTVFVASLLLATIICVYIILYPAEWILYILEMILPPKLDIVALTLTLVVVNLICSLLIEDVFLEYVITSRIWKRIRRFINPCEKCMGSKQSFRFSSKRNRNTVTFENGQPNKRMPTSYANESFSMETS